MQPKPLPAMPKHLCISKHTRTTYQWKTQRSLTTTVTNMTAGMTFQNVPRLRKRNSVQDFLRQEVVIGDYLVFGHGLMTLHLGVVKNVGKKMFSIQSQTGSGKRINKYPEGVLKITPEQAFWRVLTS